MVIVFAILMATPTVDAFQSQPLAEKFMHSGELADGESACLLALDTQPTDDETRFGLGVIQFLRAVENLGQSMYEYGAVSKEANQPFLRLPVPKNPDPSAISYTELGRVLDSFASDLRRAESTLAAIKDDNVKLRLRLGQIKFDFVGEGNKKDQTTLLDILTELNGRPFEFLKDNPDFRIHFDRGDAPWLRSYCHVLMAMVEGYRSVDEEAGFSKRVKDVFPNVEPTEMEEWGDGLTVVDAPRLRRARLHLLKVCELNRESWMHIRAERDDDFEWLSHSKQTDQLGLPLSKSRVDDWLEMMEQWEGLLKGQRLLSGDLVLYVAPKHERGQGLNIKKLLDDPPKDLFNVQRIYEEGIDAKYLEPEKGRDLLDPRALLSMGQMFDGPLGFAYAARLN